MIPPDAAHGLIILALMAGCRATVQRAADGGERLAELGIEVRALIADSGCWSIAQCRALPLGAKPCGGPWSYAVYSTEATDSSALAAAVGRYNAHENELNRREGRVSDCQFVSPPLLECVDGHCVGTPMGGALTPYCGNRTEG